MTHPLNEALEHEHREIDAKVLQTLASITRGTPDPSPILHALSTLRRHIYLEEDLLFPPLRGSNLTAALIVMLREHGEMWRLMATIETEIASQHWVEASLSTQQLLQLLERHNQKEEPVIYGNMHDILPSEVAHQLLDWLPNGTMPEGWACAKASTPSPTGAIQGPPRER